MRDAALALALAKRVHERARLAMLTSLVAAGAGFLVLSFALAPLWIAPLLAFAGSFLAWRIVVAPALAFDAASPQVSSVSAARPSLASSPAFPALSRSSLAPPPAPVSSGPTSDTTAPGEPDIEANEG